MKKIYTRIFLSLLGFSLLCIAPAAMAALPVYGFIVKNSYPHDKNAFTEGLFFKDGFLYESTGVQGHSSIRKVELTTGKVLKKKEIPAEFFGEGITEIDGNIVSLTWTSQVGFVFDLNSFALKKKFNYPGEGWGMTTHDQQIYMSDGTSYIRILNNKLEEQKRIQVTANGKPLNRLNELEWVEGELFANVWGTDVIARIDPNSGNVVGWIDLSSLLEPNKRGTDSPDAVLNGIAYDSKQHRLFVTGKLWPKLFEIELIRILN